MNKYTCVPEEQKQSFILKKPSKRALTLTLFWHQVTN